MGVSNIRDAYARQREFFASGATRSYAFRKAQLKRLREAVRAEEESILTALYQDLGKPRFEAYGSEVGFFYNELAHTLRHLRDWMDPERPATSIAHFPTRTRVHSVPKGQVLILCPWNYPFMLIFDPLQAAIAAGNTVVAKLPWQTPAISRVMDRIIAKTFKPEYICCIEIADEDIIPKLVEELRFDHIFFTGSTRVGRLIMRSAAEQLIPVTLELGGKSPAIVDETANLKVAARRIIWGKAFNAGQTCVAPDHVLVHAQVQDEFSALLLQEKNRFMSGYNGLGGFPKIVNKSHFERLLALIRDLEVDIETDRATLKMGLCIVGEVSAESPLMQEEIFGPILPVVSFKNEEDLKRILAKNPNPLSFYLFTTRKGLSNKLMMEIPFGGGCINNCLIHLANPDASFGGIATSGMGSYHGKVGFDTFSHKKTIMYTRNWLDLPIRYVPYLGWKERILKLIMK